MESREMLASLAAWKIFPSTSMLTALVHSSNRAYLGLTDTKEIVGMIAIQERESLTILVGGQGGTNGRQQQRCFSLLVVEHASHAHPLLLASRQHVLPVQLSVPAWTPNDTSHTVCNIERAQRARYFGIIDADPVLSSPVSATEYMRSCPWKKKL